MLQYISDLKYIDDRPIHRIRVCGRRSHDIEFNCKTNEIRLRIQPGPRSIFGDQGIDPSHIVSLALSLYEMLDRKLPCEQNKKTIACLKNALTSQKERTRDRIEREVEGTWTK